MTKKYFIAEIKKYSDLKSGLEKLGKEIENEELPFSVDIELTKQPISDVIYLLNGIIESLEAHVDDLTQFEQAEK